MAVAQVDNLRTELTAEGGEDVCGCAGGGSPWLLHVVLRVLPQSGAAADRARREPRQQDTSWGLPCRGACPHSTDELDVTPPRAVERLTPQRVGLAPRRAALLPLVQHAVKGVQLLAAERLSTKSA